MDPGIFMSVNTTRISFRASKIAIASSAFDASIVSKPARDLAVQGSSSADHTVAAKHSSFHELAVGKSHDKRNDPAVRKIQTADRVFGFIENAFVRQAPWDEDAA
jgi:hypothetical protein